MALALVTGGAGFIGSNLVRALLERGDDVRVLDNFSTGNRANLEGLDIEIVEGELRSYERVHNAVRGTEVVYHLGALGSVPRSVQDPLTSSAVNVEGTLNVLLADMIALYLKTKNFHWHVSGPHFRDYHLMLDEQSDQIFATTDDIAERVRKIGGTTLRSIGHISRLQRVIDNDADYVAPMDMLAELRDDNQQLTARMRETHDLCDGHGDVATASLLENWIDEAERRSWFLFESTRKA